MKRKRKIDTKSKNAIIWVVYLAIVGICILVSKYVYIAIMTLDLPDWIKWLLLR